jgi:hypothetical protein
MIEEKKKFNTPSLKKVLRGLGVLQLEYVCTVGMGKMLGAQGYVGMHMEKIEHAYNMHIDLL